MELKAFFDTDAVLVDEGNSPNGLDNVIFRFLGSEITWKIIEQGKSISLGVSYTNDSECQKCIETIKKFASLVVFRNDHIQKFDFRYSIAASSGVVFGQTWCEAAMEKDLILKGNENKLNSKTWSMLAFLLEAKNSSSIYYKFICLYKIIQIYHLKKGAGKLSLEEDKRAVISFLDSKVPKKMDEPELSSLKSKISRSKLSEKSIGEYYNHLLRDAFSHTGFIGGNNYEHGYPTLNPLNSSDFLKYNEAIGVLEPIVRDLIAIDDDC